MNSPARSVKKPEKHERPHLEFFGPSCGLEKKEKGAMMNFVETVKIDDPRLDESFSFLFVFRKGDVVVSRENRALRGQINDGVYVGELPNRAARALNPKGKTVYEVKFADEVLQIFDEKDIEKVSE
jgi:hypothetical protein